MTSLPSSARRFRSALALLGVFSTLCLPATVPAQVANRLSRPSSFDPGVELPHSVSPRVRSAQVLGHLPGETTLTGMSLVVQPSATQQSELTQLLADQQNPASPLYHKWLTPESFGARFGLSDADLGVVESWLTSRGFTVESVAPSRNRVVFSGTASAVEAAFNTTLQRFHRDDEDFFENSTPISLPASLSGAISGVTGLSSFHLKPPAHHAVSALPDYTGGTGYHFLVPWDFQMIFGMRGLMDQGFDGTGVKIGVLGQSTVDKNQLTYFQQKIGQTVKLPTMVQVPSTGTAGQKSTTDEEESELDLEYASGSAPGATVLFIYTGLGQNNGVFDSLIYGITSNQAPILTLSYGGCEADDASYATKTLEPILVQASSQGQTIVVSSGDTGAASCEPTTNTSTTATGGLSVSYPASSPNVTAVGGTQLNSTPEPSTSTPYWNSTNNIFKGSANRYIPEIAWNDTVATSQLSSSGGGASAVFGKPSWQTGPGVPADGHRDIPDVAFPSSVAEFPYIVCTVAATCQNNTTFGSSDPKTPNGGAIGGTSAAAPNFAAMLAIVEHAVGNTAGLGNINPQLYTFAAALNAGSVFHDIVDGNNVVNCRGGTLGCSSTVSTTTGTMGYTAGTGYDQVTGLGSINAFGLAAAIKASAGTSKLTPTVTLGAATTTPIGGATDALTLTLGGSGATPTGTVTLTFTDGTTANQTLTLVSGQANYAYTVPACTTAAASTCTYVVSAAYGGDTVYNGASASLTLTVPSTGTSTPATITLTPASTSVTVSSGSSLTNAISVANTAFTGTVAFTATYNFSVGCYTLPNVTVSAGVAASSTLTIYTSSANCTSAAAVPLRSLAKTQTPGPVFPKSAMVVLAAGAVGAFALRRRRLPALLLVAVSFVALGSTGCGSSSTAVSNTVSTTPAGTYTVTVTAKGTPSTGTTIVSATTTFTVVVK